MSMGAALKHADGEDISILAAPVGCGPDADACQHRPRKEAISIRVDIDVLDWLRQRAEHYQTEINTILRAAMQAETRHRRGS